ncbi:Gfo/Idh/MocA family protein [Photobacterium sp. TY1-4]|uniref:Gfo/Idh/MocA family protein n=1 Tax=Photobacterium sp. TY1-4 TaxID=2899122 RepID=UPI0021C05500|nr:Gfo/Idh/MocA family oxidoreductase [Photobacterium sp. TY1-4]UXI04568.1 Gfo/Idh/MocA family oxidoreductase [Photobacterium sp. TY1-4]
MDNQPVTVAVIGGGARGELYARYALEHPDKMKVVAVAEPRAKYRAALAHQHNLPADRVFDSWEQIAVLGKIADAVLICTQDKMHTEPAITFAQQKYHMLLEKPMSPSAEECRKIVDAVNENGIIFGVCHVMRYTRYTTRLKQLLAENIIGDVVSMQHLEPVGWWHQAHSFVRGNWRNQKESTFMLLAKACHDLDWIRFIMGSPVSAVQSFGGLYHFKPENQPEGAAERCVDCQVETGCPYSAKKIYLEGQHGGEYTRKIVTPEDGEQALLSALAEGPYGRCVYLCDNDVVDHQVVNFQFEDGRSASFTMTAFTEYADRKTRLFGTLGQIEGDGRYIKVFDFKTNRETVYDVEAIQDETTMTGHGGGDYHMMQRFVEAVAKEEQTLILSGSAETLETHLTVFAAEQSRREKRVVDIVL